MELSSAKCERDYHLATQRAAQARYWQETHPPVWVSDSNNFITIPKHPSSSGDLEERFVRSQWRSYNKQKQNASLRDWALWRSPTYGGSFSQKKAMKEERWIWDHRLWEEGAPYYPEHDWWPDRDWSVSNLDGFDEDWPASHDGSMEYPVPPARKEVNIMDLVKPARRKQQRGIAQQPGDDSLCLSPTWSFVSDDDIDWEEILPVLEMMAYEEEECDRTLELGWDICDDAGSPVDVGRSVLR